MIASPEPPVPFEFQVALHNAGDDLEVLTVVVGMFLEETTERVGQLEEALRRGDAAELERVAHRLKGTAATLALARVRDVAAALEERGAAGDLAGAAERMPDLGAALEAAEPALRDLVGSGG